MTHLSRRQLLGLPFLSWAAVGFQNLFAHPGTTLLSCPELCELARQQPIVGQDETEAFKVSLSERSLSAAIKSGEIDHLDFAGLAKREFEINAVDYVMSLFKDRYHDEAYLSEMNKRAASFGMRHNLLIIDDEGQLGAAERKARQDAIESHLRLIDTALALGCRGICVEAAGEGRPEDVSRRVVESLGKLCELGAKRKITVLVANHCPPATDPGWLIEVVKAVDSPQCAALPFFNGFEGKNCFEGMTQLMAIAKGVCATAKDLAEEGAEAKVDFDRMLGIVFKSGYRGYISLEFHGDPPHAFQGIRAATQQIRKIRRPAN